MLTQTLSFSRYEKSSESGAWVHRAWYAYNIEDGGAVVVSRPHCVTFRPDPNDPGALAESFPMPDGSRKTCAEIMADCQI